MCFYDVLFYYRLLSAGRHQPFVIPGGHCSKHLSKFHINIHTVGPLRCLPCCVCRQLCLAGSQLCSMEETKEITQRVNSIALFTGKIILIFIIWVQIIEGL